MSTSVEHLVVGGGIVGLATARSLQRLGSSAVVVIDKAAGPGAFQTGHNSGVIHSGLYYKPGSAKARMCVEGAEEMVTFCQEHSVPYRISGKVVVAVDDSELGRLDDLARRGEANGVKGLARLDPAGIRRLEPNATGIAGLHVASTGATDYTAVCRALVDEIAAAGGEVRWNTEAASIIDGDTTGTVRTRNGEQIVADHVVACVGVQSDRLAFEDHDVRIVPFRGAYFDLIPEAAALIKSMIYPVPDPRFPFLGVHFTRHIDDSVSAGPNAIMAMSREKHRRYGFTLRDAANTLSYPGTWRLGAKYWKPGMKEVVQDLSLRLYERQLRRYVPEVTAKMLEPGPVGVRAQALGRDGTLLEDFDILRKGAVTFVRNAPSPAATASLAIGRHIATKVFDSR